MLDSVEELCKIQSAKRLFKKMRLAGLKPRLLDIGGGYPVRHVKPIPSIEKIAEVVNHAIRDIPRNHRPYRPGNPMGGCRPDLRLG